VGQVNNGVAVVTGAARGQGRSHALALAGEGFDIIAVDRCADIDSIPYSKAERELGWSPKPVEKSLRKAARFFREQRITGG